MHNARKRKSTAKGGPKRARNCSLSAADWLASINNDSRGSLPIIPAFEIDLELPAEQRWASIAHAYRQKFATLVERNQDALGALANAPGFAVALLKRALPVEQQKEIVALSNLLDVSQKILTLVQFAYEVFSLTDVLDGATIGCTTAIRRVGDGVVHARTLDWSWLDGLDDLLIDLTVKRAGTKLYQCVGFVGFLGALTGIRFGTEELGEFSVSLNYRRPFRGIWSKDDDGELQPMMDTPPLWRNRYLPLAVFRSWRGGWPMASILRHALETCCCFGEAIQLLRQTRLLAPGFIALAGRQPHEGVILSRDAGMGGHEQWLDDLVTTICVANVDPQGVELPDASTVHLSGVSLGSVGAKDVMQGESLFRRDFFLWLGDAVGDDCETAQTKLHRAMLFPPLANDVTVHLTIMCPATSRITSCRSPGPKLLKKVQWDPEMEMCFRCCYWRCHRQVACMTSSREDDAAWGSVLRRRGGAYYCVEHVPLNTQNLSTRGCS